ncbi:biofilm regulation protein kinase SiaB [Dechloromonas sp. ZY10]|uniref:biofilm regulation protein kinase SiaB n=1 Tax=Dechloromonas aquae TaxID=2664436 RepID=UPI003526D523
MSLCPPAQAIAPPDLHELRTSLSRQNILLCFNGPITAPLIEEIGAALRRHMENNDESPSAVSDVFSVYIEIAQNIRRYAQAQSSEHEAATIVISRDEPGRYVICAANLVSGKDGKALVDRITTLASLDKTALKAAFKAQLRIPRDALGQGAGLGLIDMARKSSEPLSCALQTQDDGRALFSLRVVL